MSDFRENQLFEKILKSWDLGPFRKILKIEEFSNSNFRIRRKFLYRSEI